MNIMKLCRCYLLNESTRNVYFEKEMTKKVKPCGFVEFCWAFSISSFKSTSSSVIVEKVVVSSGSVVAFENGVIFKIVYMNTKELQ